MLRYVARRSTVSVSFKSSILRGLASVFGAKIAPVGRVPLVCTPALSRLLRMQALCLLAATELCLRAVGCTGRHADQSNTISGHRNAQ
jgi:hypothetical protein